MESRITFLGTGTSQGVPMIGCKCHVCTSDDPKDKRLRSSVYIEHMGVKLLIDAGPDFRQQMLRADISYLDAILLTHEHKDHTAGLDDVRAFNYLYDKAIPIYAEERVQNSLKLEYAYAFNKIKYPGVPEFLLKGMNSDPFYIDNALIIPIRVHHYKLPVLGFRIGNLGYVTDANYISDEEIEKLKGVKVFVVNTVKRGRHISHFSLEEAIKICERVGAEKSYLTHLSHQLERHLELEKELPEKIKPAFDGLSVKF